jgi:endonuclease/exonuclease/phosphatase family metal-dependent hydrolase
MVGRYHALAMAFALGCGGTSPADGTSQGSDGETSTDDAMHETSGGDAVPSPGTTTGSPDPSDGSEGSRGSDTCETCCGEGCDESGSDDSAERECAGTAECLSSACWDAKVCVTRSLRVATFNIRYVGAPSTPEFDALAAVISRIDADVVCLQEVLEIDDAGLAALREVTGYSQWAVSDTAGPGDNAIGNACLSRFPIVSWRSLYAEELSPDPLADDLTRPILRVRIHLPHLGRYVTVFNVHIKALGDYASRFRRMVEFIRVAQAVELERTIFPDNAIVLLGDFNEVPDVETGQSFDTVPFGLPLSYSLGSDITFPLIYDPFAALAGLGLDPVDATVEDSSFIATFVPSLRKLDYIFQDAGAVVVSEVYESCNDDGIDSPPLGDRMPKAGEPLPCGTNVEASDHRPLAAVLDVAPAR